MANQQADLGDDEGGAYYTYSPTPVFNHLMALIQTYMQKKIVNEIMRPDESPPAA